MNVKSCLTTIGIVAVSFSAALAEGDDGVIVVDGTPSEGFWVGVSAGFPGVGVHLGSDEFLLPGVAGRATFSRGFFDAFSFSAEALIDLPLRVSDSIDIYSGVGPFLVFGRGGESEVDFGITLLPVGVEFNLAGIGLPAGGVFAEVGQRLIFTGFSADLAGRLGFNFHF